MAFSIACNHCRQIVEPYLDQSNDKVYCSQCNNEMINITYFAKVQLKTLKQYRKKSSNSFSVKCNLCGKEDRPKLVNNDVICSGCNKPLNNLSVAFKNMLKEALKTAGKDIA